MSDTINITPEDLAKLVASTVTSTVKEMEKSKEPGLVQKFYFGTKAGLRAISDIVEDTGSKIKEATEIEMQLSKKNDELKKELTELRRQLKKE
jgi:hypothetical protein